jgi:DNA-binding NarL/FixJ family response regulator
MTHVIILAQAALYRSAWRALLSDQPDVVVAGATASPAEIDALLEPGQPTTILVDVPSPDADVARQLRKFASGAGLLFLVNTYDLDDIIRLLQAGATGCLSRDETVAELARAIIACGRDEIVLPAPVSARALAALARGYPAGESNPAQLSERESEVLQLLAGGLTNKDIAQALFLSVRTVEAHLRSIYAKLGVSSRTEAALWAVRGGFSPSPGSK